MRKKFLVITTALMLVMAVSLFVMTGCGPEEDEYNFTNEYNAVIATGYEYVEGFLENNMTYAAWDFEGNFFHSDETTPRTRTYIIKTQSELEEIFSSYPEMDFSKEMIIIYMFTSFSAGSFYIKDVRFDEEDLQIDFGFKKDYSNDANRPIRRILEIKMDKTEFSTISFKNISPSAEFDNIIIGQL